LDLPQIPFCSHHFLFHFRRVDALIRQSGVFRDATQAEEAGDCVMDSDAQERERGITILAKNLAVMRNGVKM
jgi:GTP-binding protein